MSAPKNAITVKEESETLWDKENDFSILNHPVRCICGFEGTLADLLCDPDDESGIANNFWCPVCLSHGWHWV